MSSTQTRKPRVKQHHSKVRTGCLTCKARHVKCDETRPICIRCSKGGYRCEGFKDPPKAWIFEYADTTTSPDNKQISPISFSQKSSTFSNVNESDLTPALTRQNDDLHGGVIVLKEVQRRVEFIAEPIGPYQTRDEQRALKRFLEKIVPLITRYSDPEVWGVAIPQSSWGHNAVRNSLIAAAMVQEEVESRVRTGSRNAKVIIHINAALRSLLEENPPIEVVIMTGLVLQFLETMNHQPKVALMHLRSTNRLVQEYKAKIDDSPGLHRARADFIVNTLEPVVQMALKFAEVTLEQQVEASRLDQHNTAAYETRQKLTRPGIVDSFRSLMDARNNIGAQAEKLGKDIGVKLSKTANDLVFDVKDALQGPHPRVLLSKFAYTDTRVRLGHCQRLYAPIHVPDELENQMIVIHVKILSLMIEDLKPAGAEFIEEKHYSIFDIEDIDDLLGQCIALASNPRIQDDENFKIELGIIPPLFYLATGNRPCRPASRMKAIQCLQTQLASRQEGTWTGSIAGRVAEEIFDLKTRVGYENDLFNLVLKVNFPEDKGNINMQTHSLMPELWIRYQMADTEFFKTAIPHTQTHLQRCASWTAEEISRLPKNINRLIRHRGYQGYFSEAIAAAKQV
jgi:hypothetical protein